MTEQERVEKVAAAMWRAEAMDAGTPESVVRNRTPEAFAEQAEETRARWHKFARAAIAAMQPTPQEAAKDSDTRLLDALAANCWDLKCVNVPTPGGDDADVDWIVVEHHMGKKGDVTIARAYTDDPRAALRRAISEDSQ